MNGRARNKNRYGVAGRAIRDDLRQVSGSHRRRGSRNGSRQQEADVGMVVVQNARNQREIVVEFSTENRVHYALRIARRIKFVQRAVIAVTRKNQRFSEIISVTGSRIIFKPAKGFVVLGSYLYSDISGLRKGPGEHEKIQIIR